MEKYLLVIDMQNDFVSGALGTPEAQAIVPRVVARIEAAMDEGRTVIFTQDTHTENYMHTSEGEHLPVPHCIKGTPGWQLDAAVAPFAEHVVEKPTFASTALVSFFSEVAQDDGANLDIALCGLCTDICVVSNALMLRGFFPEAKLRLYADSSAGVTPDLHDAAVAVMRSCQIDIE